MQPAYTESINLNQQEASASAGPIKRRPRVNGEKRVHKRINSLYKSISRPFSSEFCCMSLIHSATRASNFPHFGFRFYVEAKKIVINSKKRAKSDDARAAAAAVAYLTGFSRCLVCKEFANQHVMSILSALLLNEGRCALT
jgi:hypothetical protein